MSFFVLEGMKNAIIAGNVFQIEINSRINPDLNIKIFELFTSAGYRGFRIVDVVSLEEVNLSTWRHGDVIEDIVFKRPDGLLQLIE